MAFGLRTELFVKPGSFDHRREKIEQNTTNKASNVVHGLEQSLFLSLSLVELGVRGFRMKAPKSVSSCLGVKVQNTPLLGDKKVG